MSKKDSRKKRSLDRVLIMFFMVIFCGVVTINLSKQVYEYSKIKEEQSEVLAEIKKANEKKQEYENNKTYYNSEAYIEKVAREQLGMVKPNEVLYIKRDK